MPARVLPDVEADERRAERGEAAQHIQQAPLGDRRLPGVDQRLVAELERTAEIDERVPRVQAGEQRQQHGAIRLARAVRGRHQRGIRGRDRQLARQGFDLGGEQPPRQCPRRLAGLARDLRGNRRVAVAIAADPRSEHDRRGVERQPAPRGGAQLAIEPAQVARQGVPHRLLEDEETAPHFLNRRRPAQPHVFRAPHREDFTTQVFPDVLPLVDRQIRAVAPFERLRDPHVFPHQAPARDGRWMRRQDDLHPQRDDGLVERIGRDAGRQQPLEGLAERARLGARGRIAKVVPPAADAMVLLRDVGERQEVRERARDRHRLLERQRAQLFFEGFERVLVLLPRRLGDPPEPLDRVEERLSLARAQRLTQHVAEHRHVVAQRFVGISHGINRWAWRNARIAGKNRGSFSLA